MKRITLVIAVALGLAVATFAGLWSSNSASAGFNEGLKCYKTQRVQILDQNPAFASLLYISDQFQERNLIVKKPIAFCTRANKDFRAPDAGDAGSPQATDLLCYETKDAPGQARFQTQRLEVSDQFKGSFLVLTKPYALCESATKGTGGGAVAGGSLDEYEFRCYKARREEHGDRFDKISVRLFDQFERGGKDVRLGRPVVFCTQVVEKKSKAKNNHIEHAITVNPPEEFHASTISATNDRSDPRIFCPDQQAYGHSVWFSYTPDSDTKLHIDTEYSTYDTVVAVFDGYPGEGGEQIGCNDDKNFPDSGHSGLSVKLEAYQKYYILVAAFGGDAGGKLKVSFETSDACDQSNLCGAGSTAAATVVDLGDVGEAAGETLNLLCYSVSQRAPDTEYVRTQDQLTISQFAVGRGIMYCTPVSEKCVFGGPEQFGIVQAAGCD